MAEYGQEEAAKGRTKVEETETESDTGRRSCIWEGGIVMSQRNQVNVGVVNCIVTTHVN